MRTFYGINHLVCGEFEESTNSRLVEVSALFYIDELINGLRLCTYQVGKSQISLRLVSYVAVLKYARDQAVNYRLLLFKLSLYRM